MITAQFIDSLLRPNIRALEAYRSARSENLSAHLWLDANEMPWSGNSSVGGESDNRYPPPQPVELFDQLAKIYQVDPARLLITRGIDEGIDTLFRAFCEPGTDTILSVSPSYGFYEVCAGIQGCAYKMAALDRERGFALVPENLIKLIDSTTKLIILCNPNNPTANLLHAEAIEEVITATRGRCLLLIDEAYIEFAPEESFVHRLDDNPHVIIMRTFSKAWALAGIRVGVTIAHPSVIAALAKVIAPYPLSAPSIRVLKDALSEKGQSHLKRNKAWITGLRDQMIEDLSGIAGIRNVFPSDTNFILAQVDDTPKLIRLLRERGISIRDRSKDVEGAIRISVGAPLQNSELLANLKEVLR